MVRFGGDVLDVLDASEEVTIETVRHDGSPRRTIIWVVVDGAEVFVRSVRGERGRWYRDLLAEPRATLLAASLPGGRLSIIATPAADEESVGRCSRALGAKYPPGASLASMLRAATLPTTMRLEPLPG